MRTGQYDIVLMDIQMPVMDGMQATRIIRSEINKTVPILALTANAIKSYEQQFLSAGMNDLISKPYTEINLVRPIARWLNRGDSPLPVANRPDVPGASFVSMAPVQSSPAPAPAPVREPVAIPAPASTDEPLYDLGMLLGIGKDDPGFITKMLQLFVKETPPLVQKMKDAVPAGDYDSIRYYAHRMKPSITNMGIKSLKQDILKAELCKNDDPDIPACINRLDEVLQQVIEQLQVELDKYSNMMR
jgi:CheY-like chemotaxis protein